jgi:predicted DNA-binding transcriptional regulator YafY
MASDTSPGSRLIQLYAMLLFNDRQYSLTELSVKLGCSKQTVLRLVQDLEADGTTGIECTRNGNRNFYRIPRASRPRGILPMTDEEFEALLMCRAFTSHLLGREFFTAAMSAVSKSARLRRGDNEPDRGVFGVYRPGVIDYTPHHKHLSALVAGMESRRVCEVGYKRLQDDRAKTFRIKPLKIFSHHENIYVHARYAKLPGRVFKDPGYDPLLALHRFTAVTLTDTPFTRPDNYDFEKVFNQHFGVIKGKPFKVRAHLSGWAAKFAAERRVNPDQKITKLARGRIEISFSATSRPEVLTWILSFGPEARLLAPADLVGELKRRIADTAALYDTRA